MGHLVHLGPPQEAAAGPIHVILPAAETGDRQTAHDLPEKELCYCDSICLLLHFASFTVLPPSSFHSFRLFLIFPSSSHVLTMSPVSWNPRVFPVFSSAPHLTIFVLLHMPQYLYLQKRKVDTHKYAFQQVGLSKPSCRRIHTHYICFLTRTWDVALPLLTVPLVVWCFFTYLFSLRSSSFPFKFISSFSPFSWDVDPCPSRVCLRGVHLWQSDKKHHFDNERVSGLTQTKNERLCLAVTSSFLAVTSVFLQNSHLLLYLTWYLGRVQGGASESNDGIKHYLL